jgi:tRNA dimethylallyltransferase
MVVRGVHVAAPPAGHVAILGRSGLTVTMPQQPLDVRPILICGPTACGKSRLALRLAERLGGVIINADSMQVYRELRILTARPTPAEETRVRHELYGLVSGREAYSAGRYGVDAARAIAEAGRRGQVPIIVGGTGLYFRVLLEGLSPIPSVDPDVRAYWRGQAAALKPQQLHAVLGEKDPVMGSRLMPSDPQRIVRALEVLESTGRSLAEWQRAKGRPVVPADARRILLQPDPLAHAASIARRFDAMLAAGALAEVRGLLAERFSGELPIMRALGVAPLAAYLAGEATLEAAVAAAKSETRRYAKRQATWFRRNMISWKVIKTQEMESMTAADLSFICH